MITCTSIPTDWCTYNKLFHVFYAWNNKWSNSFTWIDQGISYLKFLLIGDLWVAVFIRNNSEFNIRLALELFCSLHTIMQWANPLNKMHIIINIFTNQNRVDQLEKNVLTSLSSSNVTFTKLFVTKLPCKSEERISTSPDSPERWVGLSFGEDQRSGNWGEI